MENDRLIGKIFFKSFKLKKKIGEGSFGKIYIAVNLENKVDYAVKIVSIKKINFIQFLGKKG